MVENFGGAVAGDGNLGMVGAKMADDGGGGQSLFVIRTGALESDGEGLKPRTARGNGRRHQRRVDPA